MMPQMGGVELIRRLRRDRATHNIPIIVTSALENPTGEPALRKPVEIDDLVDEVERALRRAERA